VKKRSAITVAGGVAGALVSGVAGYSVRVGSQTPAEAAAATKPIVRTQIQTITIHRKPKPVTTTPGPQTVVVQRAAGSGTSSAPAIHHTGGSASVGSDDGEREGDD
jgi:hypothetical protein